MKKRAGFTLVEILVAMTIFAVMAVLTYGGMNKVLDYYARVQTRTDRLQQLQVMFSIIKNDLEQSVNRPVRDNLGSLVPGFFSNPNDDEIKLAITANLGSQFQFAERKSGLLRVEYRLEEGKLYRDIWPSLDRAVDAEPTSELLLENLENIEFTFINNQEHEFWPLPNGHQDFRILPRAVRLVLSFEQGQAQDSDEAVESTSIERLFLVSSL